MSCHQGLFNRIAHLFGTITLDLFVRGHGYTIKIANDDKSLMDAAFIRYAVYSEAGYIDSAQYPSGAMKDEYDNHSVTFVAYHNDHPVGTIRLTPLALGSPVMDLFNLLEVPPLNQTMEIGRFAVLPQARGGIASLGLVHEIYRYSCGHDVQWWVGYAPRHVLRRFRKVFRYDTLPIGPLTPRNAEARQKMPGYFQRYGNRIVVFRSKVSDVINWRWFLMR